MTNAEIANHLEEVATLLEDQGANRFRGAIYRQGAATLRKLARPVSEILGQEGLAGLEKLPLGANLAGAVRTLVLTGSLPLLERLRGESDPETLLMSVAGIGEKVAERLHDELTINSLEELELAAYNGRLRNFEGMGRKRLAGIRGALSRRLGRVRLPTTSLKQPSIADLLDVDREYRERDHAGTLCKIAPLRFNLKGRVWLPILHTYRGQAEYTALYSNTALAHRLGKTQDWVVLYSDKGNDEQVSMVVTASTGPLKGLRLVRGREDECAVHYG